MLTARLLLLCCLVFPMALFPYSVSRLLYELTPTGRSSSALITLANPEDRYVPLEITIYDQKRDLITGEVLLEDEYINEDDIYLMPAQLVLEPKSKQVIPMRYIGDPELTSEAPYVLMIRELPIPLSEEEVDTSGVQLDFQFTIRYLGQIYVTPKGAVPQLAVYDTKEIMDEEAGESRLFIKLVNEGKRRISLDGLTLEITSEAGGESVKLNVDNTPQLKSRLLAGKERELHLPWPEGLPKGNVSVTVR